jgi:NAD+ synthase
MSCLEFTPTVAQHLTRKDVMATIRVRETDFRERQMFDETRDDYAALADEIAAWLRFHMDQAGATRLVVGLSGGIDSAVVCALCSMATGSARVIAAIMPIQSRSEDLKDAESVARTFEVVPHQIDLAAAYEAFLAAMPSEGVSSFEDAIEDPANQERRRLLALANVKPRLRMTTLYYLANRYNGLVVGTGNKTELSIGYFTKYGDGGVDLLPLGDLDKTTVRALARELGVPAPIISKPPSAGLWEGQTDEGEIGLTYPDLDSALRFIAAGDPALVDSAAMARVSALIDASDHKRRPAPIFRRDDPGVMVPA